MLIFAIYDKKLGSYSIPFFSLTPGAASRSFLDACRDPRTDLAKHPEDFSLHQIGTYDQDSGACTAMPPEHVCNALSVPPVYETAFEKENNK